VIEQVREEGLIAPGRPLVVLYSGGRDSTCLLDLAVAIAGAEVVYALHVNYGLRDSADADERHCVERCGQLGVDVVVERPRRPETGNLQAWARDARYGAAAAIAIEKGADVAAGHTATDQVETILPEPTGAARHAPARRLARSPAARVHS
jgi:tRNA(Ile)-lysidine synthase